MAHFLPSDSLKILVVEDNYGDFLLLKESIYLSKIPASAIELADTLEAAKQYLQQSTPDVILLDLFLPDSTGLESFTDLQEHIGESAVIVLSGLSDTKIALEAIALGAQDYLAKGEFDEKILERTISYSIERRRNLEKLKQVNERYSLVTKATHDLIWDWDLATNKVYRDESAVKHVYGFSSNAPIEYADAWRKRIHPEDFDELSEAIDRITGSTTGDSFELSYRFESESGGYKHILDRIHVVRDRAGKVIRLIGAAQDITEQKNAEQALINSEKRFRSLIQNSADGITIIGADKTVLDISHAVTRILGYDKESYIGGDRTGLIHPDDQALVDKSFDDVVRDPANIRTIEYRFQRADGQWIWIESSFHNQLSDPAVNAIVLNFREITDRKISAAALQKQEALFRVLLERSPDMKTLLHENGEIFYATPAVEHLLGYPMADVIGMNEYDVIHPDDVDELHAEIQKVVADPSYICRMQARVRHRDGHYLISEKIITNLLHDEHVRGIVCNSWDITKEKEAEKKIRESEEKYRQIFNDNPFPMFLYDIDTLQIIECNNATLDKYGYSRQEFNQLNILDLSPVNDSEHVQMPIPDENGKGILRHVKKNGDMMMVEVFISPIEYSGKKVRQAQVNDITDKLKLQEAVDRFRTEQQRAVTEATIKGQENEREQLGIELHDNVNQILATSKLYLEYAMSGDTVDKEIVLKSKDFIILATEEIRRLCRLLVPPSLEEFGLVSALDDLVANIGLAGSLSIHKQWHDFEEKMIAKDLKLTIYRILQEQLNNIIKHAQASEVTTKLIVREKQDQRGLELIVRDNGVGFDPAKKPNGVGLRNIRSRAELSGGMMSIHSSPGKGCELSVFFPIDAELN